MPVRLECAIPVFSATPWVICKTHDEPLSEAATPELHPEIGPLPPCLVFAYSHHIS